jgi:hypothetical protein
MIRELKEEEEGREEKTNIIRKIMKPTPTPISATSAKMPTMIMRV